MVDDSKGAVEKLRDVGDLLIRLLITELKKLSVKFLRTVKSKMV